MPKSDEERLKIIGKGVFARSASVYDVEELRSPSIASSAAARYLKSIASFAQLVEKDFAAWARATDAPRHGQEDTAQVAADILRKLDLLSGLQGDANRDLLVITALTLGQLYERLLWLRQHADAAQKGHKRRAHEAAAQRSGADANKLKARQKMRDIAKRLTSEFSPEQLATLQDSALARHLESLNLGRRRTVCSHIARARKEGLLPARHGNVN